MNEHEIRNKIKIARKWAREYFNADREGDALVDENLNFLPPKFEVVFPDVDTMESTPLVLGMRSIITVKYRLAFMGNRMAWIGTHPIYGGEYPPLWVD